jgi:transcriptional regulator with XRE-family HTH domain
MAKGTERGAECSAKHPLSSTFVRVFISVRCKVQKIFPPGAGKPPGQSSLWGRVQNTTTTGDEAAVANGSGVNGSGSNGSGLNMAEEGARVTTRRQRAPLSLTHACLRERFGSALQRQRNQRGISQTKLAELAGLSPKYVGEIERGEANVSIDLQERLCVALDWYPFELWVSQQETLPEGARTVLSASLQNISQLAQAGVRTLQAMESEVARAGSPPKPKRGRPRTRHVTGENQATNGVSDEDEDTEGETDS